MSAPGLRHLARRLRAGAIRPAPARTRDWAEAMAREIDEVDDDRAALGWAWGCVMISFAERMTPMPLVATLARLGLAAACALLAAATALPAAMILSYRFGWTGGLEALQGSLPGDDAQRFTPLFEANLDWLLAAGVLQVALYLVAGALLVFRRASAPWWFVAVVAVSGATMAVTHADPLFREVFTPAELRSDYLGLVVQAALAAAMFWVTLRREPGRVV